MERLAEVAGDYQRIGISATIGNSGEARRFLCGARPCKSIDSKTVKEIRAVIEMPQVPSRDYKEFREKFNLDAQTLARIERIAELVKESNSTLIFANTRQVVESLGSKLLYFNTVHTFGSIGVHHSSLDRDERIRVENEFKEGRVKSIIATSSLELGIDIGAINLVIQYGSPRRVTRLIQRIGRGGHRAKEISYGVILVANNLETLESLAILKQLQAGELEAAEIEENALDVLANQLCAIALEYKKVEADKIYALIRRSAIFSKLPREDFDRVAGFLDAERLIRLREGFISIGYRSRGYFFTNISVIPDAIRFMVKNTANNRIISSLDEEFVSNYVEEGAVFITKGLPWKVVSIDKEVIFVEPSADFEAAVPDWEGEDIPVSKRTAELALAPFREGVHESKLLDANAEGSMRKLVDAQKKYFVPEEKTLVIEELDDHAIVHIALGKLANEFLSKVVGYSATKLSGGRVIVRATPYALIVDFGSTRRRPSMERIFDTVKNYAMDSVVGSGGLISGTDLFRYKFVQVCKLFGIVEKRATVSKNGADRLVKFYSDSPITQEALRDLKKNYFDIDAASRFLDELRKGRIKVSVFEGGAATPLANEILKAAYYHKELLLPTLPDQETINQFEQKINEKRLSLLCTFCGLEFAKQVTAEKDEAISCPRCKSPMVSVYEEKRADAVRRKIGGKNLNDAQSKKYREAVSEAGLVEAYGSRALAALSIYGVGTATAARVLRLLRKEYKQFIVDLIEAQKNFVRTKKYWK
jgi:ATP-dependent Lhr-like helicase